MIIRRVLSVLVAILAVAATFVATNPAHASTGQADGEIKTVYFDLMYSQHVMPKRIFVTASSGPWMKGLDWDGWGTNKAVGHGTWISDCASCPGPDRRTVTITFTKPVYCRAEGVRTYRKAHGVLSEPDEGYNETKFSIPMGCP